VLMGGQECFSVVGMVIKAVPIYKVAYESMEYGGDHRENSLDWIKSATSNYSCCLLLEVPTYGN
jgi:hypothetical protein